MLGFTSPSLSSKAKTSAFYPVLPLLKVFLHHTALPEVGAMLVKAICSLPRLMLRWVAPELNRTKATEQLVVTQAKTQVHPTGAQVSVWCQGSSRAL
jgi:hypothetical protein